MSIDYILDIVYIADGEIVAEYQLRTGNWAFEEEPAPAKPGYNGYYWATGPDGELNNFDIPVTTDMVFFAGYYLEHSVTFLKDEPE